MITYTTTPRQDEILLDLVQYIKNENLKTKRVVHNNAVLLSSLAIITVFSGTTIGVLIGLVLHFSHRPVNSHKRVCLMHQDCWTVAKIPKPLKPIRGKRAISCMPDQRISYQVNPLPQAKVP